MEKYLPNQDILIFKAVDWALKIGHDESLMALLKELNMFSREPGVNIQDIWEQLTIAIEQIENYKPDPKELHRINNVCKTWGLEVEKTKLD